MLSFKEFVEEASFSVNASRNTQGLPQAQQQTYPLQTQYPAQQGLVRQPQAYQPQVQPQPIATKQPVAGQNGNLVPQQLRTVGKYNAGASGLRQWYRDNALLAPAAAAAFLAAQKAFGRVIPINSAYRNIAHQLGLSGEGHAVVGRAGTSRHGLGIAIDLQPNTPHYNWMMQNGPKFGWYYAAIKGDPYHFEYRG